jgi:hypothetical protein
LNDLSIGSKYNDEESVINDKLYAFLICMDTQEIAVMIFGVKPVIPPETVEKGSIGGHIF